MDESKQRKAILDFCAKYGSITIRDAYDVLDINSPSKRISEMRHSPAYVVDDTWETRVNSEGEKKRYKRYFIKEAAADG